MTTLYSIIIVLGVLALTRHALMMFGSATYEVRRNLRPHMKTLPTLSVIIPAHNEELSVEKTLNSVFHARYNRAKLRVFVIDDGSTDTTWSILQRYKEAHPTYPLTILTQKNTGKAGAMNNALRQVRSELVMTLDSDSTVHRDALVNAAAYFVDPDVIGVPANVRIERDESFLNTLQYYEYITSWQIKRSLSVFSIEYILGGVASTFRYAAMKDVGFFDDDTLVEDMDLTVKLIKQEGKGRFMFGSDVIAYTQGCLTIRDLFKQRFRWKFGHTQTLFKHRDMFFSRRPDVPKTLTWVYLPYILFSEVIIMFELLIHSLIMYRLVFYGDFVTLSSALAAVTTVLSMYILAEHSIPLKTRLRILLAAPALYFVFIIITVIWYIASVRTYLNIPHILKGVGTTNRWTHVARSG